MASKEIKQTLYSTYIRSKLVVLAIVTLTVIREKLSVSKRTERITDYTSFSHRATG